MSQIEEAISLFGWATVKEADPSKALLYSDKQPRNVSIAARELRQRLSDVGLAKEFVESLEPELKNALLCALLGETGIEIIRQRITEYDR